MVSALTASRRVSGKPYRLLRPETHGRKPISHDGLLMKHPPCGLINLVGGEGSFRTQVEMKARYRHRYGIAGLLLLCSASVASAAGAGSSFRASDDLVLTGAQEQLIWQRLARQNSRSADGSSVPADSFGMAVPASIALHPLPPSVTGPIPMVKPYRYTVQGGTLLIVNPTDRRIVDVIRQ